MTREEQLEQALQPFGKLAEIALAGSDPAVPGWEDERVWTAVNDAEITYGDLRQVLAVLEIVPKP